MIGHLKNLFSKVPTLALSATVTSNVLEYISKLLKLCSPVRLYKELLDRSNLMYMVAEIRKRKFEKLAFILSLTAAASCIPKTMIFVDNINTAGEIADYFQTRLLAKLQGKRLILI